MQLDRHDRALLRELQKDCQITNQALADKVGLSASVCWRRVNALEKSGVIRRYSAIVDGPLTGLGFQAIVYVSLVRHETSRLKEFIAAVTQREEVLECLATTGDADYHLRVICEDQAAYNQLLEDFLFQLPGVAHIKTSLILKEIKSQAYIPV
ncbi:Lrp/AsnC family transcriptional regulator [Hoeflea poritis]|uniref:Lrp/AsnC family transcriptional regulator n=1 Tax=Hoeflea poritis TaxID=2993659 RepID=A0ABT4VRE6_9HYPH|nr:Lrp/AsnC family transcriptional regulator [Hoeflea poritis]MDA4847241.1 Lrp/AsnC family transcriptional regulator [Hoeflea poritis]